ncbi:MAG: SufD family Fe-S cluster assembly protein [Clostridia bacterium]|nr:SufD family Fe-S cluster assembly protein [Clostridia bacterium]
MNKIEKELLEAVADLHKTPTGAYNIRKNGQGVERQSTAEIQIEQKKDKSGIDIIVAPNVKNKSVHIPVIITEGDLHDLVYNDFYIGENSDVLIVAGCGIHNDSNATSEHNGIHSFHLAKNARVRYVEKHLGVGSGSGGKILNPVTNIEMGENSYLEMETTQLGGVTSSVRDTNGVLHENANLVIKEKILTNEKQTAISHFNIELMGKDSSVDVISRSVAKEDSYQEFVSSVKGTTKCFGHVECDAILMDNAKIKATPEILAENVDATLVHEAAIGKIAGEQITKLMTLGLTEKEAEDLIIKGFLS